MARLYLIVKYTFFVGIVFSAGLAIERIAGIKHWWKAEPLKADDIVYNASSPLTPRNFRSVLSRHYLKCVTQPAKPFCLLSSNRRLEVFGNEQNGSLNVNVEIETRFQNITSDLKPRRHRIHTLLIAFTKLMKTNHIKVLLVEPSILYCLLSLTDKFDMLSAGFNPGRLQGSRNIVTLGVLREDSKKLEMSNFTKDIVSMGFRVIKFRKWIDDELLGKAFETLHYFYILQDVAVHVVVFFPRYSYIWHGSLDESEIDFKELLFVSEGIFENFALSPLDLSSSSISEMLLPNGIQYFLKEVETSKMIECRSNSSGTEEPMVHPILSDDKLRRRLLIALQELKMIFVPRATFFWLWSKSLLGWYTRCDVFHYSTTLDLAVKFRSVQNLNFTALLEDNAFLKISNDSRLDSEFKYELDCHGLLVNIFILNEDKGEMWYRHSREKDRLTYPLFPLCSSKIVGQKINVPCTTDAILKHDYDLLTNE